VTKLFNKYKSANIKVQMSKIVDLNLFFRIWVDDPKDKGTMYISPPSFWTHGGLHICDSKEATYQFKAEYEVGKNKVLITVCKQCSDYLIWLEVNVDDILQNYTDKCGSCNNFYNHVVVEDVEYYFCRKCFNSSGPAKCKERQLVSIRSKDVTCNMCKNNCIVKVVSGTEYYTEYYFCDKCQKYKGSIDKKNTKKSYWNSFWSNWFK
jgi:hypothetical protein